MYSVPPSLKPVLSTEPGHCSKHFSLGSHSWGDMGSIDDVGIRKVFVAAVLANNTAHCKLCWLLGQRSTSMGRDPLVHLLHDAMLQEAGWGVHKQRWGAQKHRWGVQKHRWQPRTKPAAAQISWGPF